MASRCGFVRALRTDTCGGCAFGTTGLAFQRASRTFPFAVKVQLATSIFGISRRQKTFSAYGLRATMKVRRQSGRLLSQRRFRKTDRTKNFQHVHRLRAAQSNIRFGKSRANLVFVTCASSRTCDNGCLQFTRNHVKSKAGPIDLDSLIVCCPLKVAASIAT